MWIHRFRSGRDPSMAGGLVGGRMGAEDVSKGLGKEGDMAARARKRFFYRCRRSRNICRDHSPGLGGAGTRPSRLSESLPTFPQQVSSGGL